MPAVFLQGEVEGHLLAVVDAFEGYDIAAGVGDAVGAVFAAGVGDPGVEDGGDGTSGVEEVDGDPVAAFDEEGVGAGRVVIGEGDVGEREEGTLLLVPYVVVELFQEGMEGFRTGAGVCRGGLPEEGAAEVEAGGEEEEGGGDQEEVLFHCFVFFYHGGTENTK